MEKLKRIINRCINILCRPLFARIEASSYPDAASQLQLQMAYRLLKETPSSLPRLNEVGFKVFSQSDEDGILLYIFSLIGSSSRKCVEFCAGDGVSCNSANLIINHGWHGLLVDGDKDLIEKGKHYYRTNPHTTIYPPKLLSAWVTRDNVNEILHDNGFAGEIDLLSIDMDGVDYWVWEAITAIDPRVIVVEFQDIIGPTRSLTVPYKQDFDASKYPMTNDMPNFCGASLPAFVKLGKAKGYRLVGCNRYGYNAFFIKNEIGKMEIPELEIEDCFVHPKVLWGMEERFPTVKDLPWVEV